MAMRLKEVNQLMVRSYIAKANLLLLGKPGIGKTWTIEAFAQKMRETIPSFQLWHFYGPTMSPMDIQASMPDNETGTLKVYSNACLPNAYTEPDAQGVVFVGEMLNTDPTTLKLLQKYVNGEDMNGVLKKPAGVMIVADSNRLEDKAGVMQQFRALLNRFLQIEVYADANDNIEFAAKQGWHPIVQAFFRENPHLTDNYESVFAADVGKDKKAQANSAEEGKRGVWACMRGWNRISDLEAAAEQVQSELSLDEIVGSVGSGPGIQYNTFKQMVSRLAKIEDVFARPDKVKLPEKIDELYALTTIVATRAKEEHLPAVDVFIRRLPADLSVFAIRTMALRKSLNLIGTAEYRSWMLDPEISKMLTAR